MSFKAVNVNFSGTIPMRTQIEENGIRKSYLTRRLCPFCGTILQTLAIDEIDNTKKNYRDLHCFCLNGYEFREKLLKESKENKEKYIKEHQKFWYITFGKHGEKIINSEEEYKRIIEEKRIEKERNKEIEKKIREENFKKMEINKIESEKRIKEWEIKENNRIIERDNLIQNIANKGKLFNVLFFYIEKSREYENYDFEYGVVSDEDRYDIDSKLFQLKKLYRIDDIVFTEYILPFEELFDYIKNNFLNLNKEEDKKLE